MKDSFYKKVINDPRLNDVPIIKVIDIIEFLKAEEKNDKGITES